MEEKIIRPFYHMHPLVLKEKVMGGTKKRVESCYGCRKPVADSEMAYVCTEVDDDDGDCSDMILHKKCGELPSKIDQHPKHPHHPIHLFDYHVGMAGNMCDVCRCDLKDGLGYRCDSCDVDIDITCEKIGIDAFSEERRKELLHPSHPSHPLTLMRKPPFSFYCDGCGAEGADMAYICSTCEVMLHKCCAALSATVHTDQHHHRLSLAFSFPEKHRKFWHNCDVCDKPLDLTCWLYYCDDCRYFVHIKCVVAVGSSTSNFPDTSNLAEVTQGDTMAESKTPVEKFEGSDFGFWKMQIEDYLYGKDLSDPLEGKPEDMKESEWKKLDRKAMSAIRLSLSRNIAIHTTKAKTTKEMMQILSDMYEKPSAANKVHLMRRLFNLKMSEGTAIKEHLNEFNAITTQLSAVEITFDDEVQALILLSSLPDSWHGTVTALSASTGKEKLQYEEVKNLVLSEDIRRRESGMASGSALNTENRGRSTSKSNSNRGRSRSKSKGRGQGKKDRSSIQCWNCEEYGHFKSQCEKPLRDNKKDQKEKKSANVTSDESGDELLILSVSSPLESD